MRFGKRFRELEKMGIGAEEAFRYGVEWYLLDGDLERMAELINQCCPGLVVVGTKPKSSGDRP
jgi:hypothetical protein